MPSKSKTKLTVIILFISLCLAVPLQADTEINFDGQIRVRSEVDKKEVKSNPPGQQYIDLRTRLGISARLEGNTTLYVQLQDSRRLGEENQFGQFQSGTLYDSKNVDLHQAYVQIDQLWKGGIGLKAGRFEVNYGNQRVFGSVGWHNVGRSWEGVMYWFKRPSFKIDYFWLKVEEVPVNRDFDIYGLYLDLINFNTQLFAFWEHDNDEFLGGLRLSDNLLDRYNVGIYYQRNYRNYDFELNGVYQFGEKYAYSIWPEHYYQDIKAYLITFETGYTFDTKSEIRIAGGVDFSSGDHNDIDDKFTTYQNSYYTGHKFRGYMDYFIASNNNGLLDAYLRGGFKPLEGWTVRGDVHYFRTHKEYTSLGNVTNDIGMEFDLTVSTTRIAGVKFDTGASIFLPTDEYTGRTDSDPGLWLYAMITANFKK